MKIIIEGAYAAPPWEVIQAFIRGLYGAENDKGFLSRISRQDAGADYRAQGAYDLTMRVGAIERFIELRIS